MKPEFEALWDLVKRATPGPWRWNVHALSKRARIEGGVPRFDLTVVDFVRWGMGGAAPRFREEDRPGLNIMHRCDEHLAKVPGREHHFDWFADIDHPDAQLMVAAVNALPSLLAAIHAAEVKMDALLAHCPDAECSTCATIICPHKEPFHFHHDGCPACSQVEPA